MVASEEKSFEYFRNHEQTKSVTKTKALNNCECTTRSFWGNGAYNICFFHERFSVFFVYCLIKGSHLRRAERLYCVVSTHQWTISKNGCLKFSPRGHKTKTLNSNEALEVFREIEGTKQFVIRNVIDINDILFFLS